MGVTVRLPYFRRVFEELLDSCTLIHWSFCMIFQEHILNIRQKKTAPSKCPDAGSAEVLRLCDELRDDVLPDVGVRRRYRCFEPSKVRTGTPMTFFANALPPHRFCAGVFSNRECILRCKHQFYLCNSMIINANMQTPSK